MPMSEMHRGFMGEINRNRAGAEISVGDSGCILDRQLFKRHECHDKVHGKEPHENEW